MNKTIHRLAWIIIVLSIAGYVTTLAWQASKATKADREIGICASEGLEAIRNQKSAETDYLEDPLETEHINEALFATGYLRHDVPLSISDQLSVRAASDWYGVPYSLCLGVIEGECNFNAENDDGHCYGLMALNRDYFPDGLESWQVIQYGVECLAEKLEQYDGDVPAALEAYWYGHDDGRRGYPNYILAFADKWKSLGVDTYEEAA